MSIDENTSIALRYLSAWGAKSNVDLDALCHGAIVVTYSLSPAPARGLEALKQLIDSVHSTFPDLKIDVEGVVAEEARVACHWTMSGHHHDKFARWSGLNMLRIREGRVVEDFGVDDGLSMLRQIGVTTIPGTAAQ